MNAVLYSCLALAAVTGGSPVLAAAQSALSPAQQAVVDKAIAKTSAEERKMVAEWSDGKKLAEFFCAKPGLAAIRKQERTADRVFLGPDDEGVKKFVLTGNTRLSGRGTVRVHGGWKEFAFVCDLDPVKATAKGFTVTIDK
ncbi:MAG: hypothetical protein OEW98_05195 [Betaproteobacteria bacterium]|jgi:hypothetical protein|nr:hypothetical protein [Betaproteobacteria bacterium]